MKNDAYTDLRTLPDGTKFHVVNGNWNGYVFSHKGEKYIHIDNINTDHKVTGDEDLIIKTKREKETHVYRKEGNNMKIASIVIVIVNVLCILSGLLPMMVIGNLLS